MSKALHTTDDLEALSQKILSYSTADWAEVSLSSSEVSHLRYAANTVTTSGVTANTSGVLTNNVTIFDNTDGSLELNLNLLIDEPAITNDTTAAFSVNGVVHLAYVVLGDD